MIPTPVHVAPHPHPLPTKGEGSRPTGAVLDQVRRPAPPSPRVGVGWGGGALRSKDGTHA